MSDSLLMEIHYTISILRGELVVDDWGSPESSIVYNGHKALTSKHRAVRKPVYIAAMHAHIHASMQAGYRQQKHAYIFNCGQIPGSMRENTILTLKASTYRHTQMRMLIQWEIKKLCFPLAEMTMVDNTSKKHHQKLHT